MKGAREFYEEDLRSVVPEGQKIFLYENQPSSSHNFNWIVSGGHYSEAALAELRREYPRLDWASVTECSGKRRCIKPPA